MLGTLPPSERLTYQIHIPWRSNGVSPVGTGASEICPAPPVVAEAVGVQATSPRMARIAASTRRRPGATVLLALTSTLNTVDGDLLRSDGHSPPRRDLTGTSRPPSVW